MNNYNFPTPAGYYDNYSDATRPHDTQGIISVGANDSRIFYWSSTHRTWSSQPRAQVQVIPATPYSSPATTTSIPANYAGSSAGGTTAFPKLQRLSAPTPTETAQFLLEVAPEMSILQYSGIVHPSSDSNNYYGSVGPLYYWELPRDLGGYHNLQGRYHYVPPNPLAAGITEGDTVLTAMNAFFQPVDMVLHRNCYGQTLASFSESTSTIPVGNGREQTCRVDRSWAFQKGQTWIKFAVVEFKRRGALKQSEWDAGVAGSAVPGKGGKICRQLKKYALHCGIRFVACCDGEKLVAMILDGNTEDWYRATPYAAPTTPARARWIGNSAEMKRHLFLFLTEALNFKLREHGMLA